MKIHLKRSVTVCLAMMLFLVSTFTAYAQTDNSSAGMMVKEYSGEDYARVVASPRGELTSSVQLELVEEGFRTVSIYSEVLCHVEVRKIKMSVSLQKSTSSGWTDVNRKVFTWEKEDYPNEYLSMATVSYNIGALSAGTYRLKGSYSVYELDGTLQEFRTVTTPGMEIR
ncbi:hypothetical protein D7X87_12015 [bacterium D16-54]|nr:hypothetical protein D7X87_12015 [bacterium D16-54]RKJ14264.1 hypothetical protein D7X65_12610 [bacterium D16-56]